MVAVGTCNLEGCRIGSGGSCIEGFEDPKDCPNFAENDGDAAAATGVDQPSKPTIKTDEEASSSILLPSGKALTATEGHQLTSEFRSTVAVLVGMVKSGKTTALAELYERFRKGHFAGHLFVGSRTLLGFEQVCHLARAASQGAQEDTGRTIPDTENNLLHLDLVAEGSGKRKRLLVSDLSGELFENATLQTDRLRAIPYLRRADHVVMFADAEKLSDLTERHALVSNMLVLLRGCTEEALLPRSCHLTVVVSRHDLLATDIDTAFLESVKARILARSNSYFERPPRFLDLAARPSDNERQGYGLSKLLEILLEPAARARPRVPIIQGSVNSVQREIDKIAFKVPTDA